MPRSYSKKLVVDKDVFCAAGLKSDPKSRSFVCRNILDAIFEICHRVVISKDINREWRHDLDQHPARYGFAWLAKMQSKRKVIKLENDELTEIKLDSITASVNCEAAIRKDIHLVEAALASDIRIISMDEAVRKCLSKTLDQFENLKPLLWVNPERESDKCLAWLKAGAPLRKKLRLDQYKE